MLYSTYLSYPSSLLFDFPLLHQRLSPLLLRSIAPCYAACSRAPLALPLSVGSPHARRGRNPQDYGICVLRTRRKPTSVGVASCFCLGCHRSPTLFGRKTPSDRSNSLLPLHTVLDSPSSISRWHPQWHSPLLSRPHRTKPPAAGTCTHRSAKRSSLPPWPWATIARPWSSTASIGRTTRTPLATSRIMAFRTS